MLLTTALLVGWILVIVRTQDFAEHATEHMWLLVTGVVSFMAIIAVLVLFSIFLAREILEVHRRTTFVDSVTHELRSPLASLRLCLETMEREGLAEQQRPSLREMMREDVERLSAFIDDILEATRLEHAEKGHTVTRVSLRALVDRCLAAVHRRHRILPEAIGIEIPADLVVATDAGALEIVLKNLLDNAIKYSDPPATVKISAKVEDNHLFVDVVDQGIGIPRRALSRVFDRFYRVDDEAVRARRGTGLGLYVVNALVRGLGGRLSAHSEGPGKGTRVRIILPHRGGAATLSEMVTDHARA
ncbi:MAG TPA: HAMP domain-containing sensor histidine kinase [Nannocystaceae bacterium]|nr:HAMP domain-containing sensor histidine kinase [Nannocystaceae bacterium]